MMEPKRGYGRVGYMAALAHGRGGYALDKVEWFLAAVLRAARPGEAYVPLHQFLDALSSEENVASYREHLGADLDEVADSHPLALLWPWVEKTERGYRVAEVEQALVQLREKGEPAPRKAPRKTARKNAPPQRGSSDPYQS